MKWLFVRSVCLKLDECSVVSIMPVRQHKCRSVTLKGLSNETWFNLSFLSPARRAACTCSSLLFIIRKMNTFFVSFFLLREGGGMVVYQWPSTCEEIISSCSLHALTIREFNWSRGRSGIGEGAIGSIFSIDKGPSPTELCNRAAGSGSGARPAFCSSLGFPLQASLQNNLTW